MELRLPDTDSARLGRNDGSLCEFACVFRQDLEADKPLLGGAEVNQPDESAVGMASKYPQFAKIFIERNENAAFAAGEVEQDHITGVFRPIPGPDHLMSCGLQLGFGVRSQAGIQQDLQELTSIESGSMRSLAAIRRA